MFLKQLEAGNFSVFAYLLAGGSGGEGLVIDPADDIDKILALADKHRSSSPSRMRRLFIRVIIMALLPPPALRMKDFTIPS